MSMKYSLSLTLMVIGLSILFSCDDDDMQDIKRPILLPGDTTLGIAQGMRNNIDWTASGYAVEIDSVNEVYAINFETFNEFGHRRENLTLSNIRLQTSPFELVDDPELGKVDVFYSTVGADGDSLEDVYVMKDGSTNQFSILEVDSIQQIIKGGFEINFKIRNQNDKVNQNNPDEIIFESILYSVKYK
ncbi:MAG: hypothetical protein AAF990_27905 [Bacteroidota bacterium]